MVYSLAAVTATINNPTYGNIEFGGGNQSIGSIGYSFREKAFAMKQYADGGATVSHNKSKAGNISITIAQTSSKYRELARFAKWCSLNPGLAESTLTVRDSSIGIMKFSAYGVFPEQEPDEEVGAEVGDITVSLLAANIVTDKSGV